MFSSPVSMSRMCHSVYISPPPSPSASWKTVSMWQSSLRWKRSRLPAVTASSPSSPGATSGSHQLHSVCQPEAACEAMPRSTVSRQRSPRCFGFLLKEFHHPGLFLFFQGTTHRITALFCFKESSLTKPPDLLTSTSSQ